MPVPVVAGDIGGPYVYPSTPPQTASFPMVSGSTKVFIGGRSVMLVGAANTGGGAIIAGAPTTTKTFIEGKLVYVGGAVTTLSTGWLQGLLQATNAPNVFVN